MPLGYASVALPVVHGHAEAIQRHHGEAAFGNFQQRAREHHAGILIGNAKGGFVDHIAQHFLLQGERMRFDNFRQIRIFFAILAADGDARARARKRESAGFGLRSCHFAIGQFAQGFQKEAARREQAARFHLVHFRAGVDGEHSVGSGEQQAIFAHLNQHAFQHGLGRAHGERPRDDGQ